MEFYLGNTFLSFIFAIRIYEIYRPTEVTNPGLQKAKSKIQVRVAFAIYLIGRLPCQDKLRVVKNLNKGHKLAVHWLHLALRYFPLEPHGVFKMR